MDVSPYLEPKVAPRSVFDHLEERATRPRFMVHDGDDWRAVTWRAYADQIRHFTMFLDASGVQPGDRVAIFANNRVAWMSAALGIQALGAVMVPIYPTSTSGQAAYIIAHCDAKVVFVTEGEVASVPDVEDRFVTFEHALGRGARYDAESPQRFDELLDAVELDQPGIMLYTSGTTGNPKGVPLTHRNVATNGSDWLRSNAPLLEAGSIDLLWLPMSHIFGYGEACAGNMLGFTTYLTDPKSVLTLLPEVRPNVFFSVPAYWEKLASWASAGDKSLAELTGGELRFCLSGGAGLKREVKELFKASGILLIEGYGLTECSPTLTLNRPGDYRFDSVGKPLPSVTLRIADDGEILAKGPSVFSGYHRDEKATREAFTTDGWFKTGDLGRFTEDGFLQIIGRKKEILVTAGGKNVPPANIEQRFADDPIIAHVVVYGDGKKYLTAGVWLNQDATLPDEAEERVAAAMARVNAELARYERIKKWKIMDTPLTVDKGFLTSTLKVRRKRVYQAFAEQLEALYA